MDKRSEVLQVLKSGPKYGLDIFAATSLRRGSGYIVLSSMEDEGLIKSKLGPKPEMGLARRIYQLVDGSEPGDTP